MIQRRQDEAVEGTKRPNAGTKRTGIIRDTDAIAALAIFPEYIEFDGEEVLKLMVSDPGRTIK